ncbi:MAG: hypothetical protein R6X08_06225 [Desulfosalsimonadaceae bacterium]
MPVLPGKQSCLDLLADPRNFSKPKVLRGLFLFPGVGEKALKSLAEALIETGCATFHPGDIKQQVFSG